MNNKVYINVGGTVIDTDDGTKIGFSYKSRWLMSQDGGKNRTFDLSVPASKLNNKVFDYYNEAVAEGVRQGLKAVIMSGGVSLEGVLYVTQWSGDRYDLLFVFGEGIGDLDVKPSWIFADSITVVDKDVPTTTGRIPNFGFYQYDNGQFGGEVSPPVSLFPMANLGYIIDTMAAWAGYSVNYPDPLLGRRYQADAYGLILPSMNVSNYDTVTISGSGIGGWNATVAGGGSLADLGLMVTAKWYKRGWFGVKVLVYIFQATRPVTVVFSDGQHVVVAGGQGYDLKNSWYGTDGCSIEMVTGDWFTVVSPLDWWRVFGSEKWNGALTNPNGYTTIVSASFTVRENTGLPSNGSTVYLSDNLPDMTLQDYLNAYCLLICAAWTVDAVTKIITITPYNAMLSNLQDWMRLDGEKVASISNIKRYIEGWAQHNRIECKTVGYVEDGHRFSRDYPVENEYLDNEREIGQIPFNDGDWTFNQYGQKTLWIDDIQAQDNGEVRYNGILTLAYENVDHDGALHVQTVNDEGVGAAYGEFTRYANTVQVSVLMPLYKFLQLSDEKAVTFRGATYVVESAQWADGVCTLNLLSVNI